MMDHLAFSFVWCAAQVAMIVVATLIISLITTRHRPDLAAQTTGWSVVICLFLTLLVPWSVPQSLLGFMKPDANKRMSAMTDDVAAMPHTSDTGWIDAAANDGFVFLPAQFLTRLKHLKPVSSDNSGWTVDRVVAMGLILGMSVGLLRLMIGLIAVKHLVWHAPIIEDARMLNIVDRLVRESGLSRRPRLAESTDVGSAAIAGFFRPTLLISREWRAWSDDQLRAVVAHELAHLVRRDSFWRLAGTICRLIHFYNPAMTWLTSRLVLAQELSADRLASRFIGSSAGYLKSLSQLALREDARREPHWLLPEIPVFSGHLIRRIEMLRAMDCQQIRASRTWMSTVVFTMLVAFAVTSTAARGVAEAENEPDVSVIKPVANIETVTQTSFTDSAYFQREKISSTHPAFKHHGAVFVNVSALSSTGLWPALMQLLTEEISADKSPINVNAVKTIAADCLLTIRPRQGETNGQVMFGFSRANVDFNQEIDWPKAIKSVFADAKEIRQDNRLMFEVTIPAIGPWPARICPLNSHEVAINQRNPEKQGDEVAWPNPDVADRQHDWADEWDAISGGHFTVVMTRDTSDQPISDLDFPGKEQVHLLNRSIDLIAIGIDFLGQSEKFGVIVRFGCKADEDAESILSAMEQLFAFGKEEFLKEQESQKDSKLAEGFQFHEMLVSGISAAKTRIIRGERNVIEAKLELTLPAIWMQLPDESKRSTKEVKQSVEQPNDSFKK